MMTEIELQQLFREDSILEKASLVAEMYYVYKMSQKDIATQMKLSRPWVSKLLKRAEEAGIVTIRVETAWAGMEDLEKKLQNAFSLKGVKVTSSGMNNDESLRHSARACSHYLISILNPNDIVALSWGYTLGALAQQFAEVDLSQNTFVPLVGGMGEHTKILSNHIVETIAQRTNANYQLLHLPAFVAGKKQKDALLIDPAIQKIIKLGENANIILCSIGTLYDSTMCHTGYLSAEELSALKTAGAVGDIALQFINKNGEFIKHPVQNRIVSGDFQKTKKHACYNIALAIGLQKVPVIYAALKGNLIDILVTDSCTANALLATKK